jgi:hypothetical protein
MWAFEIIMNKVIVDFVTPCNYVLTKKELDTNPEKRPARFDGVLLSVGKPYKLCDCRCDACVRH